MDINGKSKIGEIVEKYPIVKTELQKISPAFKKMDNPILWGTMSKVANLEMVSEMTEIDLDKIIGTIKSAIGKSDK